MRMSLILVLLHILLAAYDNLTTNTTDKAPFDTSTNMDKSGFLYVGCKAHTSAFVGTCLLNYPGSVACRPTPVKPFIANYTLFFG